MLSSSCGFTTYGSWQRMHFSRSHISSHSPYARHPSYLVLVCADGKMKNEVWLELFDGFLVLARLRLCVSRGDENAVNATVLAVDRKQESHLLTNALLVPASNEVTRKAVVR